MKKLFLLYCVEKKDCGSLTLRQLVKFCKDFRVFEAVRDVDKTSLGLLYSKRVSTRICDFRAFVDILFKISKFYKKEIQDREYQFKDFLDEVVLPTYKIMCAQFSKYTIERIQIFHQNMGDNEVLDLFLKNDNLLKHVSSLKIQSNSHHYKIK